MIRMNSLADVEPGIADLVVQAELAGAGIPAFETMSAARFRRWCVQGLLQFEDGQAAAFTRGDDRYHVTLHKPMPIEPAAKFETRRIHDSEISAKEFVTAEEKTSAIAFDLMSSLAVKEFVQLLLELHGKPVFNACKGPQGSVAFFLPEAREFLPAPRGDRETARLDIRALLAHSRCCSSDTLALELMEDALWQALTHFGDRSRKAMEIRASLAKNYARHIDSMQRQLTSGTHDEPNPEANNLVESVERCQTLYIRTLRALGRHKPARSEEAKLPAMRQAVEQVLIGQLNDLVAEIRDLESVHWGPALLQPRYALTYHLISSLAFTTIRLAEIYRLSGREEEGRTLEREGWKPALTLGIGRRLAEAMPLAQTVSTTPHRYEDLLLAARDGRRASRRRRRVEAAQQQGA